MYDSAHVIPGDGAVPNTTPIQQTVVQVQPKVRFIGNHSNTLVIIPDLKNEVDDSGLSLQPGTKYDLLLYYTPQEINRSRGLDNALNGIKDPKTGEYTMLPVLSVLGSMDEKLPELPLSFIEQKKTGSYEAAPNYADENLARIAKEEQKEMDRISARNGVK